MYLSKIRVKNYKSFRDSGDIEFKPGINLIVGQNNSGKTALLEILETNFINKPHKNKQYMLSHYEEVTNRYSEAEFTIVISPDDLQNMRENLEFSTVRLKAPKISPSDSLQELVNDFNDSFINGMSINFTIVSRNNETILQNLKYSFYESLSHINQRVSDIYLALSEKNKYVFLSNPAQSKEVFGTTISKDIREKNYRFFAERVNLGRCDSGFERNLNSNCQNLAEVLQNTQNHNSWLYEKLIEFVSQVYPSIKWISSIRQEDYDEGNNLKHIQEIYVWTIERQSEREDLAVSLSECGTGVGQVLAILYVIITSKEPRTIIIDEPNSFLHPSAAQKLIQILNKKEFSHHQYFISTHSPEIVTASKPSTITMLNYEDGETKVEQIDLSNNDGIKKVFKDLGIEPATFAFANHILWVEGPTEEKAFSLILKDANIHNVVIKPTVPSEFRQNRKRFENVRHIFELHKTVSGTDSVISPKMTILLDKEIEKESENNDLIREFGENEFNFIPRAMFENYLIATEAIEYILNFTQETQNYTESDIEFEKPAFEISLENINKWIAEKKISKDFLPAKLKSQEPITDFEWLVNVDGAKLLDNLFKDFLGKPFGYERYKVEYGAKLTQWLLENKPEQLSELKEFLINLISDK
jgi:predicted ATP-dependent endonuclease of OLD family